MTNIALTVIVLLSVLCLFIVLATGYVLAIKK